MGFLTGRPYRALGYFCYELPTARGDPYRAELWGSELYIPKLVGLKPSYAWGFAQVALIGLLDAFSHSEHPTLSGF